MCARPRKARKHTSPDPESHLLLSADSDSRVVRRVSLGEAKRMTAAGLWRDAFDADGQFIGFQIVKPRELGYDLPSQQTSVMISAHEMKLIAFDGVFGDTTSRTKDLSEDRRYSRDRTPNGRMPKPEDAIERAIGKLKAFESPASRMSTEPGSPIGDRAVRVYPKG